MIQIEKIEVKYFRSIYNSAIKKIGDLSVLCGKNDTGKSNYLRALNLFFNNETDWKTPLNFYQDFNLLRLEECRKSIKGKQFIRVKIHFIRGDRYLNSLPERFWISKTWGRDDAMPQIKNSLTNTNIKAKSMDRAQAGLNRYLSTIHYEYIPAIKDRSFFTHAMGRLQDAVMDSRSNKQISGVVKKLNDAVVEEVGDLKNEFRKVVSVDIDISLPTNLTELFSAFSVSTNEKDLPFTSRGDGIQARFLPSLLHHIAKNSNKHFIWGFEEPENCMEHGLATKLANEMEETYSDNAQVLLTSHSPAFIDLKKASSKLYRVALNERSGSDIKEAGSEHEEALHDLGLIELQKKHQKEYEKRLIETEKANEVLTRIVQESTRPLLLVEGKTDKLILEEAWSKIYDYDCSFTIESCSTTEENETAGCNVLKKALESGRPNMQATVGLFDYDDEGIKSFEKLDRNFVVDQDYENLKIHRNRKFSGLTFPRIEGLDYYMNVKNLVIEYLFPENALQKKVDDIGLTFKQEKKIIRVGSLIVSDEHTTELCYRSISGNKVHFAERIVPTLEQENFSKFEQLFNHILDVFERLDNE